MKKVKKLVVMLVVLSVVFSLVQPVYADKFWTLYQQGETRNSNGDVLGAIESWKGIINLYDGNSSVDAMTKSAVYWTRIAQAYEKLGWYGEAQDAYKNVERFWNNLGEYDSAWGPNRYATRLETDMRVYAKVPAVKAGSLAKYEPVSGAYFGAPFDKDPEVGGTLYKVPEVYGKDHTAYLMYVRWGEDIQYWTADQAKHFGRALQIAWEPPADMKSIKQSDVSSFADKLKNIDVPIFLRFASEMNEISNPWSQNSPEVYKESFRMVANTMHKEAPNVAMVWAPLYVPMDTIDAFYPGDEYVDWVGVDAYTDRYYIGDPNYNQMIQDLYYQGYYANPLDRFKFIYDNYSDRKPIFIAETGVQNYSNVTSEDFSNWANNNLRRLYSYLPMVYPRVKAIFYFNVDSDMVPTLNLKQNYGLSKSQSVKQTYKDVISSDYYLSNINDSYEYKYEELQRVSLNKNNVELSTYSKIAMDPYTKYVNYFLDGKKIGISNVIPFTIKPDLSKLKDGNHILKVDAYNSKNILSAKAVFKLSVHNGVISVTGNNAYYIPKHKVMNDISSHWAKAQINELVGQWNIDGYDDGTFKPEKIVTRAEFYKILSNSLGMGLEVNSNSFDDIPYGHWAKKLIDGGVELGIIPKSEYPKGFNADKPISRSEAAMLTVRALNGGNSVESKDTNFKDNNTIALNYKGYVFEASRLGIIDGFPDGTFKPNDGLTRAQAVSMVIKAVSKQN